MMSIQAAILVVDDEPDLLEQIKLALEVETYQVFTADDGLEALKILQSHAIDLILADIAMPNMNGYQLYERVRQKPEWAAIPFIFLTARSMDSDIRYGKELGVDDYLSKPIRAADILAVVRGKLKRARQLTQSMAQLSVSPAVKTDIITVGQLKIDSRQYRVWLNKQEIKLSAKEFAILDYLAQQAGGVISLQQLIQITHEFETDHIEAGNLLRPLILSLRRKLNIPTGEPGSIENVRGVGYRLVMS